MEIIAADSSVTIRKMEPAERDFRLFLKWMTDPETMKYWEGMTVRFTYEKVVEQYREHQAEKVEQCIIEYEGAPAGYCQYCLLNAAYFEVPAEEYAKFVKEGERAYGIDIFLGEVRLRNRGIGTRALSLLADALLRGHQADVILIDPKVHNARAIRCYHKCGFADYFVVPHRELQDGTYHDSLIMGLRK